MPALTAVFLQAKGDVRKVQLKDATLTQEAINTLFKKKTSPKQIGTYEYGSILLTLFGYLEGRAGTENKHELPPPHDEILCFGDILVVASKLAGSWKNPVSFTPEQYETFYQRQFGGFEDIGSEDSETDSDNELVEPKDVDVVEELEEAILAGAKKKVSSDDVEADDAEEEIDEEDEEEDEEVEEAEDAEVEEADGEDYSKPVKAVSKSKKKTAKVNLTVQSNTGRAKQHALQNRPGFKELATEQNREIPDEDEHPLESKIRRAVIKGFTAILGDHFDEDECIELEQIVLEKAFHEAEKKCVLKHFDNQLFRVIYEAVARRICANLSPTGANTVLLKKLQSKDLTFDHLRTMGVQDLNPGLYTELRDRQLLREQNLLEGNKSMATDLFECSRCHKRQCTFYELQTRSADEPMTKFITCLNCNKRWRQ